MANEITLNLSYAFAQAGTSDKVSIIDLLRDGPNSPNNRFLHVVYTYQVATVALETGGIDTADSYIMAIHRGTTGRIDIRGTSGETPTISLEAGDVSLWRNFNDDITVQSTASDVPVEWIIVGA